MFRRKRSTSDFNGEIEAHIRLEAERLGIRMALGAQWKEVLGAALLGLVATWIPAQRALSIDPAILLREE